MTNARHRVWVWLWRDPYPNAVAHHRWGAVLTFCLVLGAVFLMQRLT